jgi:hypothetical protein
LISNPGSLTDKLEDVTIADLSAEEKEEYNNDMAISGVSLNTEMETIVRYTGLPTKARPVPITIFWYMAKADFQTIFKDFNGYLRLSEGYIVYKGQKLHLIVLGEK